MKTKDGIVLVLILLLLPLHSLTSDEMTDYDTYTHALGAQLGVLSGWGLSYHQRINTTNALQMTVGLLYDGNPENEPYLEYSVGLEWQRTLYSDTYANWFNGQLYAFLGINHTGYMIWDDEEEEMLPFVPLFGLGGGIGVELILLNHISIPLEFGYGAFIYPLEGELLKQLRINFLGQIGLRYRY